MALYSTLLSIKNQLTVCQFLQSLYNTHLMIDYSNKCSLRKGGGGGGGGGGAY